MRGEAGRGVLAVAHGERPGVGRGPGGALAKGLRRLLLFVTDGLPELPEAIRRIYPQAEGSGAWCTGCGGACPRCRRGTGPC